MNGYPHRKVKSLFVKIKLCTVKTYNPTNKNMNISVKSFYDWYRSTLRNPKYRWWLVLGTVAYIFSPIDIAPDFIPIIGQLDDIMVLSLLVSEVSQLVLDYARSRQEPVASAAENTANSTVDVNAVAVE